MKFFKLNRKIHKWLMLFLGIQFVIWSVTGAYMVVFGIDYIHGDNLVKNLQTRIDINKVQVSLEDILKKYPKAQRIELGTIKSDAVYRLYNGKSKVLVSATTGVQLSPLGKESAIELAKHYYSGNDVVSKVELITQNAPSELSSRYLPVYRVDFETFSNPSLYISTMTGLLVTKRHDFWRVFDYMFRFHVADYNEGNPHNWLLFWLVLFSIVACISGLVITYYTILKKAFNKQQGKL